MDTDLKEKLALIRKKRNFSAEDWISAKCKMFNEYMSNNNLSACVVSVSGGLDSAVTYALALEAQKSKDSPIKRVVGISQPIHSTEKIFSRAYELKALGGEIITVDQTKIFDSLVKVVEENLTDIKPGDFAKGQLKSYMRTPVGYYVAQLLSQNGTPCIVLGTGNKDEDGYLLYFCKAGDGICDVQLIADLHKSEVFTVAKKLKVPDSIIVAPPSADLWEGQTDEEELGMSYDFVELYTEYLQLSSEEKEKFKEGISEKSWKYFEETGAKADSIHKRNAHKLKFPVNLNVL